jgi:YfiH family protein
MSRERFVMKEKNGIKYFVFPHLEQTGLIVHGITTRFTGVSLPPYDSLNLAFHTGDDPEAVRENRKRLSLALGFDFKDLVSCQQVHGTEGLRVDSHHRGCGSLEYGDSIPGTDGLLTTEQGIPLLMNYADCVPVIILDPVKRVLCLCHAGWKGSVDRIAVKMIKMMKERTNSAPEDCLVGIGPSIGPCCYEVDEKVVEPLTKNFSNWSRFVKAKTDRKWLLNLWELNRWQLVQEGVRNNNIVISGMCTSCWHRLFFSHRSSGGVTGRIAAVCLLK